MNDYAAISRAFILKWLDIVDEAGCRAYYSGLPSSHGTQIDGLEGFSRMAPFIAALTASNRNLNLPVVLPHLLLKGFTHGVDRKHQGFWGDIVNLDQRVVEAADIALALWITRNSVWPQMTGSQQGAMLAWLTQATQVQVSENNWLLFVVLIELVIFDLTGTPSRNAKTAYDLFRSFYAGNGWFRDGRNGPVDYYNAYAIHYLLFWFRQIDSRWDRRFLEDVHSQFIPTLLHLIGPKGFPVMGRSICYRLAISAPLIQSQMSDNPLIPPGQARRALDATWSYFIEQGAIINGNMTQGYFHADPRLLDNYSGPASCLWGLRSLTVAYMLTEESIFLSGNVEPLPVEMADYEILAESIGWKINGHRDTNNIEITFLDKKFKNIERRFWPIESYGMLRKSAEVIFARPLRPENIKAKYARAQYSSESPFCIDT